MRVRKKRVHTLECGHIGRLKKGCGKRDCWNYHKKIDRVAR